MATVAVEVIIMMPQTEQLKRIIAQKTGLIELGRDDAKLHAYFSGRMHYLGLNSLHQYVELLSRNSPEANDELKRIAIDFSNTESFFFRDHGQMRLLKETILPELIIKNQNIRTLNILSAASSSGEELYSIAILLSEILPDFRNWKITLLGVDINHQAIKKAEKGIYSKWSFRSVPMETISKYFTKKNNDFAISEEIRKLVLFKFYNLVDDLATFPLGRSESTFDLIVCRNVFIYFETSGIKTAVNNLIHLLKKNGYLLTGHSELANMHFPGLKPVAFPDSFIYQKTDSKQELNIDLSHLETLYPTETIKNSKPQTIKKRKISVDLPPLSSDAGLLPEYKTNAQEDIPKTFPSDEVERLISEGSIAEGESITRKFLRFNHNEVQALLAMANICANRGLREEARICCDLVLETEAFNPLAYFVLGQLANEEGEIENALLLFNKVLYLNHEFFPALIELATIYEFQGDRKKAIKLRQNALEKISKLNPESPIVFYKNMKAGRLAEELKKMTEHL